MDVAAAGNCRRVNLDWPASQPSLPHTDLLTSECLIVDSFALKRFSLNCVFIYFVAIAAQAVARREPRSCSFRDSAHTDPPNGGCRETHLATVFYRISGRVSTAKQTEKTREVLDDVDGLRQDILNRILEAQKARIVCVL